jgi:hypothetical protein
MRRRVALWAGLLVCGRLGIAGAQEATRCELLQTPEMTTRISGTQTTTFAGGGVHISCPGRRITLRSDSAELYANDRVYLVGHVQYDEPRFHLEADFLTYWIQPERIFAVQNVRGRLPTGSTMQGPQMEFLRAVPRVRARQQLTATGRPTFSIVERDAQGREQPPVNVTANTVFMLGDSLFYGSGNVVIQRPEITARSDSAFIDSEREFMRLMREPRIDGTRGRPYSLTGQIVDVFSANRRLQRVRSNGNAVATSQDLTLRSDTIDLRVTDDLLQHAISWSGGERQARAVSSTQSMIADSIDVVMPQQRVRVVRAIRSAFAEGRADTLRFRADTTNWLRGDTIVAYFDSTAQRDTTKGPAIEQLHAIVDAKAYYHLSPQDTTTRRPAISYVTGREITLTFKDRTVSNVSIQQQTGGVYLEPATDTAAVNRAAGQRPGSRTSPAGTTRPPAPRTAPPPTRRPR